MITYNEWMLMGLIVIGVVFGYLMGRHDSL